MADLFTKGVSTYLRTGSGTPETNLRAVISTRFYPSSEVPQTNTTPYATFQVIGNTPMADDADGDSGLGDALMDIVIWADTYATVSTTADLMRLAMNGYSGDMGGFTIHPYLIDHRDLPQDPTDGSEKGPQAIVQEWGFEHEYTAATFA